MWDRDADLGTRVQEQIAPPSEKLLIARTPHTNGARNRINAHFLARGETHGSMAMHADGTAYVVSRGTKARILRGASWFIDPRVACVGVRSADYPRIYGDDFGVRWVAVRRP